MSVGEKLFKCFTCESKFSQPKALIEHISSVHVAQTSHNCQKCDATFPEKLQLQKHIISVHKVIRSFNCSNCSKKFLSKRALETHKSVHEVQNPQYQEESEVHDRKKQINLVGDSTKDQGGKFVFFISQALRCVTLARNKLLCQLLFYQIEPLKNGASLILP